VGILAKVGSALQQLFGEVAEAAAEVSGVIQRQRRFTELSLAQTFVLGFLRNPSASDEELAQWAAQCGVAVTPQAIEQRYTPRLAKFLQELFARATKIVVGSDRVLAPILERFTRVIVLDSTTITLPDDQREEFAGCGGPSGSGQAALKLQTELDLRTGALAHVEVEPGRRPDVATSRQQARHGPGTLRITDLGFFDLAVFAAMMAAGEHFLSRLKFGTHVLGPAGAAVDMLPWLARQPGLFVDQWVWLGQKRRLGCRLIAWRLPSEQATRRRRKLRQEVVSKRGHEPCAEHLAWCDWTILVTSVPPEKLTPPEAVVMYRARWQVELLFKRWKSQGLVAALSGSTAIRQVVRVWARLLAALVQHWLVVATVWGNPTKSLSKTCEAARDFVSRLAASLNGLGSTERVLGELCRVIEKTCRRNKRSSPGTWELLNDVTLLNFRLT
jgi:Transposase DDE domain